MSEKRKLTIVATADRGTTNIGVSYWKGTGHLGRTLEFIKLVQDKRDNNRSQAIPAGDGPSRRRRKPAEKKSQRSLNGDDMLNALKTLQSRSEEMFGTR